jgi:prevent-host-death family protein
MKRVSITEAKNNLSALIDRVKRGSAVLIVDRGRPVARLEPLLADGTLASDDARLSRLIRDGIVRPGRGLIPKALLTTAPPKPLAGTSVLQLLLEDRREGR